MKNRHGLRWQVILAVIGSGLYGFAFWIMNKFPIFDVKDLSFSPAPVVPIFWGIAFGPWQGLIAGLAGHLFGQALAGWGILWNWSIGNGLMGMIPGLGLAMIRGSPGWRSIGIAIGWGALGIAMGSLFISLTEIVLGGIEVNTALRGFFVPLFLGNLGVTVVLLPVLMLLQICYLPSSPPKASP
jgi:hypothetical protein